MLQMMNDEINVAEQYIMSLSTAICYHSELTGFSTVSTQGFPL